MILNYKKIDVFYTSEGKGKTIVLLHGFLEELSMWKEVSQALKKTHRVICIDLLGHGKTPCLGYVHTMEDHAQMVHAVLKTLRLRKYIIIGHSMGGYIALAYAKLFTNNIKGLCLMNSSYEADDEERKLLRARANKMVRNNYENMVRMSFTNLFSEESRATFKVELEVALKKALKTPLQGYIASQEGMRIRKNTAVFFSKAVFHKKIILGQKDWIIDIDKTLQYSKKHNIPTSVFSQGHMSHIENKEELIYSLKEFAKKCS